MRISSGEAVTLISLISYAIDCITITDHIAVCRSCQHVIGAEFGVLPVTSTPNVFDHLADARIVHDFIKVAYITVILSIVVPYVVTGVYCNTIGHL